MIVTQEAPVVQTPAITPTAHVPPHINSLEALLDLSVAELETLSDAQLNTVLAPLFPVTRPSAEREAYVAERNVKDRLAKAMANLSALESIGL